jgi:hypothetical protein
VDVCAQLPSIGGLVASGARTLGELRPMFYESSEHPETLDVVKQLGFYSDCYGAGNWSDPAVITV